MTRPSSTPFDLADESIRTAPLPLPRTLRRRRSLPLQLWRFLSINLKIVRMVRKPHDGHREGA